MSTAQYGKPTIGCYLDHANYNVDELNRETIRIAIGYGMVLSDEDQQILDRYDNTDMDGPDDELSEQLNWLADEAIDYLNSQESRTGLYWGNDGEANAFGLWIMDIEEIKDQVNFVSVKSKHAAERLGIETNPDDSEYPPHAYRGEWLHVNERGNCTLYLRKGSAVVPSDYKDIELWSIV